jgi:hypothetical protein
LTKLNFCDIIQLQKLSFAFKEKIMNAQKLIDEIKKLKRYESLKINDNGDTRLINYVEREEVISVILKFFAENQSSGLKLVIGD